MTDGLEDDVDDVRVITDSGTHHFDAVTVRPSGFVVCRKRDERYHYPPHRIKQIKGPVSRRADQGVRYKEAQR